jgi:hypothetical protein
MLSTGKAMTQGGWGTPCWRIAEQAPIRQSTISTLCLVGGDREHYGKRWKPANIRDGASTVRSACISARWDLFAAV